MTSEDIFRLVLAVELAVSLPAEAYFRWRTRNPGDRLDRRQEGFVILLLMRPLMFLTIVAVLVFIADPQRLSWSAMPLPMWLREFGIGCGIGGSALMLWAFAVLGRNLTDTVVSRPQATMITAGPYRYVRHPVYLSFGLVILGDILMTASWFVAASGIGSLIVLTIRTATEERFLIERFGDAYRAYRRSTGGYFPNLRSTNKASE